MTLDDLRRFGADVDDGLRRCVDNESFYLKMVEKCINDPNIELLGDYLRKGDAEHACECAHAVKGVASNLSLTPFRNRVALISDLLKEGRQTDYIKLYYDMMECVDELRSYL